MKLSFQKDWKLSSGRNQPRRSLKMFDVAFAAKNFLFLLLLIPGLSVWYYFRQRHRESDIRFSSLGPFAEVMSTRKERARHLPFILRMIALTLLILALARPQSTSHGAVSYTHLRAHETRHDLVCRLLL